MYCHQCGAKAIGIFCSNCGIKLKPYDINLEQPSQDWAIETRYEFILNRPEVRNLIASNVAQSHRRMSSEDFLGLCDKALVPLTGVSLAKIGVIVQPVYETLGIKTAKMRKEIFTAPVGKIIVAALCSLARHGQPLNRVEQGLDGCLLKADLPSDMWSFSGDFLITIQRNEQGSFVEATTIIKGQLFDWGKSKRILTELFNDLNNSPV